MNLLIALVLTSIDAPPATWSSVAPIIQEHCATCHVDGGPAPFTLVTHDDIARRRSFVAEVLRRKLMPPWLPSQEGLELHGDRTMPETERAALVAWLESGAPVGTKEAAAPLTTAPPSPLPEESIVLTMPEAFMIPAETLENEHRYHQDTWSFVIPVGNAEPMRLRGIAWKSTAPRTVHTVTLLFDGQGRGRQRDHYDSRVGYELAGDLNRDISGTHGGVGIGMDRMMLPEGFHWNVPANADIVADVRYRPIGREVHLQDEVSLVPAGEGDSREIIAVVTAVNRLKVAVGESRHVAEDRFILPEAMDVVAILPRARNECRSMRLSAIMPQGTTRILIDIPEWDAHYRSPLLLKDVLHLPAGTTLHSQFTIDNTTGNPRNPFDPPEDLRMGQRTGAAAFTLLGAGRTKAASEALVARSQYVMDRRGRRSEPSKPPTSLP